jgi:RimJ/RimL family protein N-acetyltransferase
MWTTNSTDVDKLGAWAWERMGYPDAWTPVGRSALGFINDKGEVLWAAVYEEYHPNGSVRIHIAISSPKFVTRRAISEVFEYPFYQLGVKKVIGIVDSANTAALAFDIRLGFKIEAVVKDAYDMGDMYILSMTRDECQWLRGKEDGSQRATAAA